MVSVFQSARLQRLALAAGLASLSACGGAAKPAQMAPMPDARVGLKAGLNDAGEAISNLNVLSRTPSPSKFSSAMNSDLAFTGKYAIQGNYNGFMVWDISTPTAPVLASSYYCPASQNDVSVYKNLLFMSSESTGSRKDCADGGAPGAVNLDRVRGVRIFDITDITKPKLIKSVETCRGSHTHTVVEDPKDRENIYIYISGSSGVRPAEELPGCVNATPDKDPNSSRFKIEIIKVPVAHPEQSAIISTAKIFENLQAPPRHGETTVDIENAAKAAAAARAQGKFTASIQGSEMVISDNFIKPMLDSTAKANGHAAANSADSTALRSALPIMVAKMFGGGGATAGPDQCHDITVYPSAGLAGGACGGYGLLLDIRDPAHPVRIDAAADSNFSYWHSATFNNDATKVLFSDEWGGGSAPKCRSTDPKEWGADAIFTLNNGKMAFKSYYKLPAPQTANENCVAHNGSLIPIPGRDVMIQAWYQGGISVFDWTDASHPMEIASFDRGPVDSTRMAMGGSWSVYWYNGAIVSSEIARGLDVAELKPSQYISQNEIDAAKTVHYDYLNAQGQPKMVWPPSFALARSYVDQLERSSCLGAARIASVRADLSSAEKASAATRQSTLSSISTQLANDARNSCDAPKVQKLMDAVRDLGSIRP
ncbi:MAG: repeat-containing protein [Gemmatimonadetes bacterium]|nr:repeat-containing protein [Gemmatimonadota bacterium]